MSTMRHVSVSPRKRLVKTCTKRFRRNVLDAASSVITRDHRPLRGMRVMPVATTNMPVWRGLWVSAEQTVNASEECGLSLFCGFQRSLML
jgi:hypothetical protein